MHIINNSFNFSYNFLLFYYKYYFRVFWAGMIFWDHAGMARHLGRPEIPSPGTFFSGRASFWLACCPPESAVAKKEDKMRVDVKEETRPKGCWPSFMFIHSSSSSSSTPGTSCNWRKKINETRNRLTLDAKNDLRLSPFLWKPDYPCSSLTIFASMWPMISLMELVSIFGSPECLLIFAAAGEPVHESLLFAPSPAVSC